MNPEIIYHVQPGPYWDWKVAVDLFLGVRVSAPFCSP